MTDRVVPASMPAGAPGDPAIEPSVRILPLGGLGEIGLNMMMLEAGEDLLAVDCGLMFPDDEMPGIDYVIPDFSYLLAKREQVRGVILTHAHEDHIGALPYLLRELDVPVYGPRMALALAGERLREHGLQDRARLVPVEPRRAFDVGGFRVEPIRVTHSVVDGLGYGIETPVGTIVHTGDFKFDPNPIDGERSDYHRLAELGERGRPLPHGRLHERRPAGHHALRARGRPGPGRPRSAAPRAASSSRRSPRTCTGSSRSSTSPSPSDARSRSSGGAWRPACASPPSSATSACPTASSCRSRSCRGCPPTAR